MWEFLEDLHRWIRIPLALMMIAGAWAMLAWAPWWWARSCAVLLAVGLMLLIFGGSSE